MLDTLSAVVKQCSFQDAKNTSKDPCLLGPPSLEFAPYGRVPGNRVRKDGRQGTIDQDPEFIDFLQSLTEPVPRFNVNGEAIEGNDTKPTKVTTTPLVEYLKEKKANKGKDGPQSKTAKPQGKPEAKDAKSEKADSKKVSVVKKEGQRTPEKAKVEKPAQDAVKAVKKSVTALKGKSEAPESASSPSTAPATRPSPVKRERERSSASVAAKILQRDLGLAPAKGERRTSRTTNSASKAAGGPESESRTVPSSPATQSSDHAPESTSNTPAQSVASAPSASADPPTGPRIGRTATPSSHAASRPVTLPPARPPRPSPAPAPGAKSAFLKHANFSQGVTEELLRTAFSSFGAVTRCEIDRKKGFGYVDFDDTQSLKRAILASPVKVGDKGGQVVVLENKNLKTKPQTPLQQPVDGEAKAPVQPQIPAASTKSEGTADVPLAPSLTSTPTAPRGAHGPSRGGTQNHGPRGGYAGPPRGGFNRGVRGGRANFRARGAFDTNRGSGHAGGKHARDTRATTSEASPAPAPKPDTNVNTGGPTG
jgi:regulator of nonsense transcripts 3